MKQLNLLVTYIVITIFSTLLSACSSKDKKIADVIKISVKETLHNPDSYLPVETKIDSLIFNKYGDTISFDNVMKAFEARDNFDIASAGFYEKRDLIQSLLDSSNPSSHLSEIKEEKAKLDKYLMVMDSNATLIKSLSKELQEKENNYDNRFYGWRVTHTFSYKSKNGDSKECTYVFFMDETFSRVLRYLDEDKITYDSYVEAVDLLLKNEFR